MRHSVASRWASRGPASPTPWRTCAARFACCEGAAGEAAAPGVLDLPGLAQAATAAGYEVHVEVEDLQLPSDVDAAVFRLVQEGITNALKHSNGRRVEVSVGREAPDRLAVHVLDDGRGATVPTLTPGHGLSGMRERVTDLGGRARRARQGGRLAGARQHPPRGRAVIRVLLADDQQLLRDGLRAILEGADDIEVVGEAANGREAMSLGRELRPAVVLMDLQMPTMTGHEAIRAMRADPLLATTPVLVLTTFDAEDDVVEALAAGADGYLLKDIDADGLRRAVRNAAEGRAEMAPGVLRQLMGRIARLPTRRSREEELAGLTERELDILTHVGLGMTNEEIGRALFLSPETARTYVSRLLTKLGARDRAQLVVLAHRPAWSTPPRTERYRHPDRRSTHRSCARR